MRTTVANEKARSRCEHVQRPLWRIGKYAATVGGSTTILDFLLTANTSYPKLLSYLLGEEGFWALPIEAKALIALLSLFSLGGLILSVSGLLGWRWGCYRFKQHGQP